MTPAVNIYLDAFFVGNAWQDSAGNIFFKYYPGWLESAAAQPVSLTLPLKAEIFSDTAVRPFLEYLLPDTAARSRVAECLGIPEHDLLGLLAALGGDCPGRVSVCLPQYGPESFVSGVRELDARSLAALPLALKECPLCAGDPEMRLCLPGAGTALPVVRLNGRFALPVGDRASTHVLKISGGVQGKLENEALCMTLAKMLGLWTAEIMLVPTSTETLLLVQRGDRHLALQGEVRKFGAESLAQALQLFGNRPLSPAGLRDGFRVLARVGVAPVRDQKRLVQWAAFNWLIGNTHASWEQVVLVQQGRGWSLAPFFGLVSTAAREGHNTSSDALPETDKRFETWLARHPGADWAAVLDVPQKTITAVLEQQARGILRHMDQALDTLGSLGGMPDVAAYITERVQRLQGVP
ncbi:MAG: HipA domain-containing protein [Desulfohalobium sp.]